MKTDLFDVCSPLTKYTHASRIYFYRNLFSVMKVHGKCLVSDEGIQLQYYYIEIAC